MARVLVLVQVFPPDNVATAQLYGDLVRDLTAFGDQVSVLTTSPHYSLDPEATAWLPSERVRRFPWGTAHHSGIRVCRAWMPDKRANYVFRACAWSWFHLVSTLAGLIVVPRPDVILCASPPPTIALGAWLLSLRYQVPFVYNAQELYPDVAVNLGLVRNALLIRLMLALERFIYDKATAITVISGRMRKRLLEKGVPAAKVIVVPNFADLSRFSPLPKDNSFSRQHALSDKFVVSYAGNMGKPQHLEVLLQAADRLRNEPDIRFVLVGGGAERSALVELARRLSLPNVLFLPYQSYSVMGEIYAASDISYVPQAAGTSSDGVPSKVYRIMASGRPVLAATDPGSDLAGLVADSGGGMVVGATDAAGVASAVLEAFHNRAHWQTKGQRAREHVAAHYSRETITRLYHELLNEIAAPARGRCRSENC